MAIDVRQTTHQLLDHLPDVVLREVLNFIDYLHWRFLGKAIPGMKLQDTLARPQHPG